MPPWPPANVAAPNLFLPGPIWQTNYTNRRVPIHRCPGLGDSGGTWPFWNPDLAVASGRVLAAGSPSSSGHSHGFEHPAPLEQRPTPPLEHPRRPRVGPQRLPGGRTLGSHAGLPLTPLEGCGPAVTRPRPPGSHTAAYPPTLRGAQTGLAAWRCRPPAHLAAAVQPSDRSSLRGT